ncbi:SGNH/GDSL hydrolase family protein [Novosphingobium sp. Leaf2]|uniref:SGNH/GDSL hydrolase family protein n=1 Tax=Novosphingobium sp. Leaf2 TaxID=1735670 RepID=UPI0009EB1596|nr:SGNH/GDSL hydrolase family protein [Novosphingobium sp. Leaf2]
MHLRRIALRVALPLLAGVFAPLAHAQPAQTAEPQQSAESLVGMRYVAIGSSYAAGPMLPPAKPSWPARCGQSFNNYPTLLAERLGMELIDRTCSGATTEHVLGPWGEVPPQISSVTADTRLVTITIGGNDLSYVGNLFSANCAFNARVIATPGAKARACGPIRVPVEPDYARDEAQMTEIARRIRSMAPQARIVFVQYPRPLPRAGALCAATPISEANAAIVREIGRRLVDITNRVAKETGSLVVDMAHASIDHSPCDKVPWMIGAPQGYDGRLGLQWHLNKLGMQSTANAVAAALIKNGVAPISPPIKAEPGVNPTGQEPTMPAPNAPAPADRVPAPARPTPRI